MYLYLFPLLLLSCGHYKKVHFLFPQVVQSSYTEEEEQEVKANRLTEGLLS